MTFEPERGLSGDGAPIYPPRLAEVICALMPEHPLLVAVGAPSLGDLLSAIFFASLQTEEGEHQPIQVAVTTRTGLVLASEPPDEMRLRTPCACTTRHLLRLSRAARSDRISIIIVADDSGLHITGLARELFGDHESAFVKIRAPRPGCLDVWISGVRLLEYVRGYIQKPPEDVLLSTGPVRERLLALASQPDAPGGYIDSVADILRHLADHPHGGILVLSAELAPETPDDAGFAIEADTHLWELLHAMERASGKLDNGQTRASLLERETIRSEIQISVRELGRMTALDGAVILDRRLGLRGFGVVLPVRSDIAAHEVIDAAGTKRVPFSLDQYGARHRAAASYAANHPGSLVFIASVTGDIGCMLQDEPSRGVLLWRFRSGDISMPTS